MVDYEENDEITPLPCSSKHFFHTACIEHWLKSNNSCPMCKKPLTIEDLKKQKKEKRGRSSVVAWEFTLIKFLKINWKIEKIDIFTL